MRSWAVNARKAHISHVTLFALDAAAAAAGERMGLIVLPAADLLQPLLPASGGAPALAALAKPLLLRLCGRAGHDVLFSEPDVAWLRNPGLYFSVYDAAAADLLVASESMYHFIERSPLAPGGRDDRSGLGSPAALSVLLLRSTPRALALADAWVASASAAQPPSAAATDASLEALLRRNKPAPVETLMPVPGGSWIVAREQASRRGGGARFTGRGCCQAGRPVPDLLEPC